MGGKISPYFLQQFPAGQPVLLFVDLIAEEVGESSTPCAPDTGIGAGLVCAAGSPENLMAQVSGELLRHAMEGTVLYFIKCLQRRGWQEPGSPVHKLAEKSGGEAWHTVKKLEQIEIP